MAPNGARSEFEFTEVDLEAANNCEKVIVLDLIERLSRLESANRQIEDKLGAILQATNLKPPAAPATAASREAAAKRPFLTHHHVWWLLIFPVNAALLALAFGVNRSRKDRADLATTLALANLLPVIAIRDGTLLLMLYKVVIRIPFWKYFFNRMLHCNGGIHTGCSIMLLMWATISLVMTSRNDPADFTLLCILCVGISLMMLLAIQPIRESYHNIFERVHRYLGWLLLLLLAAILIKKFTDMNWNLESSSLAIVNAALMVICLVLVFYPWCMIERQKVQVKAGQQGSVVVVRMQGKARPGAFAKISFDLVEWHAFSVAFSNREDRCYGLIVGVAGDWTKKLAQKVSALERMMSRASSLRRTLSRSLSRSVSRRNQNNNNHVRLNEEVEAANKAKRSSLENMGDMKSVRAFIRWHRPLGFMYSVYAYKRVVCVGTGAGIAPILPHIGNAVTQIHVVWIAKKHREIYGDEICDKVFEHEHKTIYDTSLQGRPSPDMAIRSFEEFQAEAIFVVSNLPFTEQVREACKKKNIPGYGAVFDS